MFLLSLCGLDWNAFLFRAVQAARDQRVNRLWMRSSLQSHHAQREDLAQALIIFSYYYFVAWVGVWRALKELATTLNNFKKKRVEMKIHFQRRVKA